MKIIFLDIDGVLCTMRSHIASGDRGLMRKLDPIAIGLLNHLVDEETRIVISSSWRKTHSREEIERALRDEGFTGLLHEDWCTPRSNKGFRGDEVADWLTHHPEVSRYICLDDDSDFHPGQPLVKTSGEDGLMLKDFLQASLLLHGDENAWLNKRPEARSKNGGQADLQQKLKEPQPY